MTEITHDKRGWPHLNCPSGQPMGWLGSRFWICTCRKCLHANGEPRGKRTSGTIWVADEATGIKKG